jgi:hypothetical protein
MHRELPARRCKAKGCKVRPWLSSANPTDKCVSCGGWRKREKLLPKAQQIRGPARNAMLNTFLTFG